MKSVFIIIFLSLGLLANSQIKINDKLECSWLDYDLGSIEIGKKASCVLSVKNTSEYKVNIDYLFTSCRCVTVSANKMEINPNETLKIYISYDSSNKSSGESYQQVFIYLSDKSTYAFRLKAKLIANE